MSARSPFSKTLVVFIALAMIFCLAGCGSTEAETESTEAWTAQEETTEETSAEETFGEETASEDTVSEETAAVQAEAIGPLTMYTSDYLNVRTAPSTDADIAAVLDIYTGVTVTGIYGDWYVISYGDGQYYVYGDYLITEEELLASSLYAKEHYLETVDSTDQVIFVIGDGSAYGADFYFYTRDGSDWTLVTQTYAGIGVNGFNDHTIEGDRTTPTGCFELGIAFGIDPDPGTALTWVDVTEYLYWVDDLESDYYNQLIDIREVPDGWSSAEHLIDYTLSYAYAINIEVNPDCTKDSTSAIFLHCYGSVDYTYGCVAVSEQTMVDLLLALQPGAIIVIASDLDDLEDMI